MTLATRVARLFRADLHAVMDRLEEPDVLLRQAIREMHEAVAADRGRVRSLARELETLDARIEHGRRGLAAIDEELNTCFDAGREDLARAAVRRRLQGQRLAALLARRREAVERNLALLRRRVDDEAARLAEYESKATLLAEEVVDESADAAERGEATVRDDEVEVAFLRARRERGLS